MFVVEFFARVYTVAAVNTFMLVTLVYGFI
jgi:hypothetical protein